MKVIKSLCFVLLVVLLCVTYASCSIENPPIESNIEATLSEESLYESVVLSDINSSTILTGGYSYNFRWGEQSIGSFITKRPDILALKNNYINNKDKLTTVMLGTDAKLFHKISRRTEAIIESKDINFYCVCIDSINDETEDVKMTPFSSFDMIFSLPKGDYYVWMLDSANVLDSHDMIFMSVINFDFILHID